jgi:phosphoserine phosphatase RsbU/P
MNKPIELRLPEFTMNSGRKKNWLRYAFFGAGLGLLFPIVATIMESWLHCEAVTLKNMIHMQMTDRLLWVINTAPFFLGFFAGMGGVKQDRIETLVQAQDAIIETQTSELKQGKNHLENIIDSIADLMLVLDTRGIIREVNTATLSILGYKESELVGQSATVILSTADLARIYLENNEDLLENKSGELIEGDYLTRYGHTVSLRISVSYLWNEVGDLLGAICMGRDVTSFKEQEDRFKSIVKNAGDAIVCADSSGTINLWNKAATRIFGYPEAEALGRNITLLMPERFREAHSNGLSRFRETRQRHLTGAVEIVGCHKDGHEFEIELNLAHWETSNDINITSIIRDISARKQLEEALQQSEEEYRGLVQSMNTIVMKADSEFRFTFLNEYGQEFFGFTEDELLGKSIIGTIVPELESTGRDMKPFIQQIIDTPENFVDNENENIRKNGDRAWVAWRNQAVLDEEGNLLELMSTGYDITDRKNSEAKLQQKTGELNERLKEMECLNGMAELAKKPGVSLDEIYEGTIDLISRAMQYTESTHSRIVFDDGKKIFCRHGQLPIEEKWSFSAPIRTDGKKIGRLIVFYSDYTSPLNVDPFVKEEKKLIEILAAKLGESITLKNLEGALIKSEEQYKTIFNESPIAMFVAQDGKTAFMNSAKRQLSGISENDDISEISFSSTVHPDDLEMIRKRNQKRMNGESVPTEYSYRIITTAGDTRWVENRVAPFEWEGRPATLCFQMDITDRKEAEEKIQDQNLKLEAVNQQISAEMEQARLAQLALLPKELPNLPKIELAIRYKPMEQIGGDFYDLFTVGQDQLGIVVGDVTGHGIPAALLSFLFLTTFKNSRLSGSAPDIIMNLSNAFLAGKLPKGKYASIFYSMYDPENGLLRYTSAGHPPAFLIRPSCEEIIQLQTRGMVVGMFEDPIIPFENGEIELFPGDKLLIYTDGILEITDENKQMQDSEKLENFLMLNRQQRIGPLLDRVFEYCLNYSDQGTFDDDVTMIGMEVL